MHKFKAMKKLTYLLIAFIFIVMSSCQDPAKSRIYMDEGNKLMINYGKFEEAEEALTQAIKYDKNNYEAYYLRGCAKVNAAKYKESLPDFEQAIKLKPDYADAYFNIARVYTMLRDEDKACEYFKLADKYGRPNIEDYLRRCR